MINFLRLHFTHKPLQGSQKRIFLHIVYNHKAKAFSTLTHFPFNKNFTIITPRFPFTLSSFRFMQSSATRSPLRLQPLLSHHNIFCRHLPKYVRNPSLNKTENNHTRDDLNLTKHEAAHTVLQEKATGKVVALLTSSKGTKAIDPNVHFEKLDAIKADGSFTPLKDPITKKPVLDAQGNPIPDPHKGGQYIAVFSTPRKIQKDAKPFSHHETKYQAYIDQHESKIETIIDKANKNKTPMPVKKIGGKDDE